MNAAFKKINNIGVKPDGSFVGEVSYVSTSGGSGNDKYTIDVSGFIVSGKLDPSTLKGSGTISFTSSYVRKEKSPLAGDEGETKEYVTSYVYDDIVEGSITISPTDGKVGFDISLVSDRNGYTKLQYHAINKNGDETWGDNPTITDKSGETTGSGTYIFMGK